MSAFNFLQLLPRRKGRSHSSLPTHRTWSSINARSVGGSWPPFLRREHVSKWSLEQLEKVKKNVYYLLASNNGG